MLRHIVMKAVFVLLSLAHTEVASTESSALFSEPSYAKWGKLAVLETKKMYQDASIVDYKYEGRKMLPSGQANESFVLWVHKDTKEFGVRVVMTIEPSTDQLVSLKLTEINAE
ncbi:hypothetical protein FHS16_002056 [Paenibacillus endophyticus]|uniref:DUF3889 domain-containing protein n=1 Tax=Paenibacillus endophyticus TaxID=1294268 RepID=A0A7W5C7A8_9BACL|nr:DUF3889 domain-containing protein [Paenibacillus endophyticus]MBB3152010.1 hypothetical protein [Paenibacillus endophyticus]